MGTVPDLATAAAMLGTTTHHRVVRATTAMLTGRDIKTTTKTSATEVLRGARMRAAAQGPAMARNAVATSLMGLAVTQARAHAMAHPVTLCSTAPM